MNLECQQNLAPSLTGCASARRRWKRKRLPNLNSKCPKCRAKKTAKKLSHKDQRELDALPATIEKLEAQRSELTALMGAPEFYQQDKAAISKTQIRVTQIEAELKSAYARWEELEALRG